MVLPSLLINHNQLARYAVSLATMVDAERHFFPKPEGAEHANFSFPGVEDRVRYYMVSWYDNILGGNNYYNGTPALGHHICKDIPLFDPKNKKPIQYDRPFIFDEGTLLTMRMKRLKCYEHDALQYFYLGGEEGDYGHNNNSNSGGSRLNNRQMQQGKGRRMIFQFGDAMADDSKKHPIMIKACNVASASDDTLVPILALLAVNRHYGELPWARQYYPWEEKRDTIVFQGATTGNRLPILCPFIIASNNGGPFPPDYDFSFTRLTQNQIPKNEIDIFKEDFLTKMELMKYKYLLVLPGNDVATGLKWMLYSDSVVIMPTPQKVSWAMEDLLVPYIHYIPVQEDLSDLQSQLKWARANDDMCRNISKHATQYMMHLYASEKAQEENDEIRRLIS